MPGGPRVVRGPTGWGVQMGDARQSDLRLFVLGPLEVQLAGRNVHIGGRKQRAVLAVLALRPNRVVAVDDLVEVVWGEVTPARPTAVVQVYVANIRKLLEPHRAPGATSSRVISSGSGYSLQVAEPELDLLTVDTLLAAARSAAHEGDLQTARQDLRAALALWRGVGFPDLVDVPDLQPEIIAVEERRLNAWEDLLELDLAMGEHGSVVAQTQDLIASYPFRERLWAARVLGLWRSQRQAEALHACRLARRCFRNELGADPGPQLRELEQAVLRQDPTLNRFPSTRGSARRERVNNLPAPLSGLIGRVEEQRDLVRLLHSGQPRLISLTGPGGIGKTRLALAAARASEVAFGDGVCWVALDRLSRPEQVLEAVAAALGVPPAGADTLTHRVSAFLRSRRLLLVLDNFEQVLEAWPLVVELLSSAPGLTVLATSRTALEITGEQVYAVPPLSLPDLHSPSASTLLASEAASLFLDRATLADHSFRVSEDCVEPLAQICHRLDGLPLALELAAARIPTFSPPALLTALNDALGVLTGGPRDAPDRQRTLRGAITWSYELLAEQDRQVLIALGVFSSAPDTTALAAVLDQRDKGALAHSLQTLARASLIQITDGQTTARVVMLKTVRDFAVERLSPHPLAATYRERHARHYLLVAETTSPALSGPTQVQAFERLDDCRAEFDEALAWAVGTGEEVRDRELSMRLIRALWHYWEIAGHVEQPRRLGERLLDDQQELPPGLQGAALVGLGTLTWLAGDYQRAAVLHRRAVARYRAADDIDGVAWALMCLATQEGCSGQVAAAHQHALESLQLARRAKLPRTCVCALMILGLLALWAGKHSEAEEHNSEALVLARQVGDTWLASAVMINIADVAYSRGDYSHAAAYLREVLDMAIHMRDRHLSIYAVEAVAEIKLQTDQHRRAVHLLAAATRWRTEHAQPLDDQAQQRLDQAVHQARAAVGGVTFAVLWAEGQGLDLDDAVALARTGS